MAFPFFYSQYSTSGSRIQADSLIKVQIETVQKEARALTHNGALSPVLVSGEILDIFLKIERAWALCSDVDTDCETY